MSANHASDEFLSVLDGKLHFDLKQLAFCTHYSWFGVVKHERLGIEQAHLFYNRNPALLSPNLLTFHVDGPDGGSEWQKTRTNSALSVSEDDGKGFTGKMAFLDSDILCYCAKLDEKSDATGVRATLLLPATDPPLERRARFDASKRRLTIETSVPRTDARDPDPSHLLTLCVIVPEGFGNAKVIVDGADVPDDAEIATAGPLVFNFAAERDALIADEQVFVVGIGEGPTADKIEERMARVHLPGFESAQSASMDWLAKALDEFSFDGVPKQFRLHYVRAVYQILCNTKTARGQISRHAAFPSRGTYCGHWLWDSCFVSRGVGQFNERLAEDFLVALCENLEDDGKVPQFICATWNRPDASQPPLIAWAAWHLYERFGNKELLRDVYGPVARNIEWWFAKRDDDGDGLVEYLDGLESGWDDSPRFDDGRIAGVDLNSYINREMRMLAKMAPILGKDHEAAEWESRAEEHGRLIYSRLFDVEDRLFYDRLVAEDRLHKVLTPASFAPLWCEIKLPAGLAAEMINKYLINPKHFFGARPFPCVAYSDRHYESEQWWRGPVWPNIAWMMTEVLRMHGFEREHKEAVRRLLDMMTHSDDLSELYSSSTGKPLGATALGWSCAMFMEMCKA
jgi:hypothetical protein